MWISTAGLSSCFSTDDRVNFRCVTVELSSNTLISTGPYLPIAVRGFPPSPNVSKNCFAVPRGLSVTIWVPVPKPASGASAADDVSPIFRLRHAKSGVDAQAQQIDGEFTMLAGSSVVPSWHGVGKAASTRKAYMSYRTQHEQLLANGSIVVDGDRGRLNRNVVFPAPSTAGAVALGRSCNGRREWIASEGTTFGDWESRGVE